VVLPDVYNCKGFDVPSRKRVEAEPSLEIGAGCGLSLQSLVEVEERSWAFGWILPLEDAVSSEMMRFYRL
jgi:hypothetical protein